MESVTLGAVASLVATVVFETAKFTFSCLGTHDVINDSLYESILNDLNRKVNLNSLESDYPFIREFLELYVVQDTLNQFFAYKLVGRAMDIKEFGNQTINAGLISKTLVENYYQFIKKDVSNINVSVLEKLFGHLLSAVDTVILSKLTRHERFIAYCVNNKVEQLMNSLAINFDDVVNKLEKTIRSPFYTSDTDLSAVRNVYNNIQSKYYSRSHIYLQAEYELTQFYIAPILVNSELYGQDYVSLSFEDRVKLKDSWRNVFFAHNFIYLVAKAGYGKSLFLKMLACNYHELNIINASDHLVIYCDLKSFYSRNYFVSKSIVDFLQESMIDVSGVDINKLSKPFIEEYLHLGRCIVLFDALDEVPRDLRDSLHKKIVNFFTTYSPNNKICISSRDRGFIPDYQIKVLKIAPLCLEDIEEYLNKMVTLNKFRSINIPAFLSDSLQLISNHLLDNFLILSLLVNIYIAEKKLPSNKVELYKKCIDYIFKEREEEIGVGYNWKILHSILSVSTFTALSELAAPNNKNITRASILTLFQKLFSKKFPTDEDMEQAASEFLDYCSNRTELLVLADKDNEFHFFHRSFFEYCYSRLLYLNKDVQEIYKELSNFDIDSEVFELIVAILQDENQVKYQSLIDHAFYIAKKEFYNNENRDKSFSVLVSMLQVVDDTVYVSDFFDLFLKNVKYSDYRIHFGVQYEMGMKVIESQLNVPAQFSRFNDVCGVVIARCVFLLSCNHIEEIKAAFSNPILENYYNISALIPFIVESNFYSSYSMSSLLSKAQLKMILEHYCQAWNTKKSIKSTLIKSPESEISAISKGVKTYLENESIAFSIVSQLLLPYTKL